MSGLQSFNFAPGLPLRTVSRSDGLWFIAGDVTDALGIVNVTRALAGLDMDEKGLHTVKTPGGTQSVLTVSESGLYSIVLRSRKPAARAFRRWVTGTVLPTLRREGMYVAGEEAPLAEDISEGELLAHMEALQARLDAIKAAKVAEFRARCVENKDDRSTALRTYRRLRVVKCSSRGR